jgi:hypothetical protein
VSIRLDDRIRGGRGKCGDALCGDAGTGVVARIEVSGVDEPLGGLGR